jgi:hypothetical protein
MESQVCVLSRGAATERKIERWTSGFTGRNILPNQLVSFGAGLRLRSDHGL